MISPQPSPQPQNIMPYADTVTTGPPILPIERIRLFSAQQWEEFVLEWVDGLRSKYKRVERCGGAGDMGRDVIAFTDDTVWDNYQCKHYDHPLRPSDIWLEIGKLVYYTFINSYSLPRKYFFIAPQGAGTTLINLLKKPEKLREELTGNWERYCQNEITRTKEIFLDSDVQAYLKNLDFSIFDHVPPLVLIDQHRQTPYHIARFGGGLPGLQADLVPPEVPTSEELGYLRKLFDAYEDHLGREVQSDEDLQNEKELAGHYGDSRLEFYSAETLRGFSRDTLPEGVYESLQNEIHDGVRDVIRERHDDGYRRVIAVVREARKLQLTSNALISRLHTRARGGICHQLANERDDVKWV